MTPLRGSLIAVALLVASCRPEVPKERLLLLQDPEVSVLGNLPPYYLFDGSGRWMLPGPGWAPAESTSTDGDWRHFAWIQNRHAEVRVDRVDLEDDADFVARCTPFDYPGRPEQIVSVEWQGALVGSVALQPGWQVLRFPLPPGRGGLLERGIELRFSRAASPLNTGSGSDARRLSAACNFIGVVPRAIADVEALIRQAERFSEARDPIVRWRPGNLLTVTVPPDAEIELRLADGEAAPDGCHLETRLESGRGAQPSWRPLTSGEDRRMRARNAGLAPALLRLRARETRAGACDGRPAFDLLSSVLEASRRHHAAAKPASHFVYVVDTLRLDAALEAIQRLTPTSTALDRFWRASVRYDQARVASSWTLPSVVSILSGTYPDRHGIMQGDTRFDGTSAPSLPERLASLGYETVAISHSFVVSDRFGLDHGFERFLLSNQLNGRAIHSQETRRALASWLALRGEDRRPVFAYLHTVEPHRPYSGGNARADEMATPRRAEPGDPVASHARALYQVEADRALMEFGAFLQVLIDLGLYDDATIVFTSDHGEEFAEHFAFDHGRTLFEEQLRVPLWIKYPGGGPMGGSRGEPVSLADLAPTLLELAGASREISEFDGESLESRTGRLRSEGWVFAAVHPIANDWYAEVDLSALVFFDGLKCLESGLAWDQLGAPVPPMRAFDLHADPAERSPLPQGDPRSSKCIELFERFRALRSNSLREGRRVSGETLEQLRALGYIR